MKHITESYTATVPATDNKPVHEVKVFITDVVLDYKDKAVLKHLVNSNVDILKLKDIPDAYRMAEKLMAQDKLVTSQAGVNIRYKKWNASSNNKNKNNDKDYGPCEEPSDGPDKIYTPEIIKKIMVHVITWCRGRKFQSFLPFYMLDQCVQKAVYNNTKEMDDQQKAVVDFIKKRFADRYCVISPFNNKGYNLGSELMSIMYPEGVKYRAEQYVNRTNKKPNYYIIKANTITNVNTGEVTEIPKSTLGSRNEMRLKIDQTLYYSKAA